MRVLAVIPARYASTRLPGKPLADIRGKPMIQHVWEHARAAGLVDDVIVATDDARIATVVKGFGGRAVMTSPCCHSGSDRLLEVARFVPADIYINIQGDEPLLRPEAVDALARSLSGETGPRVATLCYPISAGQAACPDVVKVVRDTAGNALYFSRAAIPFARDGAPADYFGHCGVYAYTTEALRRFGSLSPSPLEQTEKLEQLRLLQAGIPIRALETAWFGPAVDTAKDLASVRHIMENQVGVETL